MKTKLIWQLSVFNYENEMNIIAETSYLMRMIRFCHNLFDINITLNEIYS
jgi:hypothetical protein